MAVVNLRAGPFCAAGLFHSSGIHKFASVVNRDRLKDTLEPGSHVTLQAVQCPGHFGSCFTSNFPDNFFAGQSFRENQQDGAAALRFAYHGIHLPMAKSLPNFYFLGPLLYASGNCQVKCKEKRKKISAGDFQERHLRGL